MKGLLIFCLVLTVVTAVPLKGKVKNYSRKQLRQDVVNAPAPTPSAKVPVIGAAPVDIIATRPVVGNKPFRETEEAARPVPVPAKEPEVLPSQATVVQPAVVAQPVVPANVAQPLVTVAQPAPAIAQPAPAPAQPAPVPAQPVPVPAQPTPAPAQPVPAPAQPVAVAIPAQPIPPAEVLAQPVQPAFVNGSLQSAGEPEASAQPAVPAPPPVVVIPQPPAAPLAPGTEPVVTPAPVEVSTKKPESEEDDSSSEEEEAEARQLAVAPTSNAQHGPNVKDFVVNAFVTPNGEVLVPLDVYQKYFHQHQAGRRNQVPLGIFSRQENEPTSSASSEEENDADASGENSEESIPVRVSGVKPEKVKPVKTESEKENVSNVDEEDDGDEKEKPAAAASENENETDDKSASAESEEKPGAAAGAESGAPVEPVNSFVRPPLAAIPATRPTQEDDEEEAGRYAFPFYDEFFQDDGAYENEFFHGNNYYRIEPRDEESGFEF